MQPMMANHLMIEAKTPEKGLQIAIDALKKIHNELGCNNQVCKNQRWEIEPAWSDDHC